MIAKKPSIWKDADRRDSHFIGIALLLGLLLPHGGMLYFVNPILVLLLAFKYSKIVQLFEIKAVIITGIVFSALGYMFLHEQISNKEIFRSVSLIMMLTLFPLAKNIRIPDFYLLFGILYIVLSQLSWVLGYGPLIDYFVSLYPYEGDMRIYQTAFLREQAPGISIFHGSLRLGGMYHNANQFAKYLGILYVLFLLDSLKSYKFKMALSAALLVPILYAGSRTGLIVFSLLFLGYTYRQYRLASVTRKMFLGAICIIASGIAFMLLLETIASGTVRAMSLQEGIKGSILPKWSFFEAYLDSNPGVWQLLFGSFDISLVVTYTRYFDILDSEWGNALFAYGIVFCLAIVAFYVKIFRRTRLDARLCFILLLWAVSGSVLFSYRASFIFLLVLSKYYVCPGRSGSVDADPLKRNVIWNRHPTIRFSVSSPKLFMRRTITV